MPGRGRSTRWYVYGLTESYTRSPPFSIIDRVLLKLLLERPRRLILVAVGAVVPSAESSLLVGSPVSAGDLDASPTTLCTRCPTRRPNLWRCGPSAAPTSRLGIQ